MDRNQRLSEAFVIYARLLEESVSETPRHVVCSWSAVVRIFLMLSTNWQQGFRYHIDTAPQRQWRRSCLIQANRRSTVAQVTQHFIDGNGRTLLHMAL